jgi:thiamine pyrophosphate-dependent acetolactate synthase large subunit-like protein
VFDFCAMARAAGFRAASRFATVAEFDTALPRLLGEAGPSFIYLEISREYGTPRWPGASMAGQVQALRAQLSTG